MTECFLSSTGFAQVLNLPAPGVKVVVSEAFMPVMIKGLKVHPENPLLFDFIIDTGDEDKPLPGTLPGDEAMDAKATQGVNRMPSEIDIKRLIKYFLAALTIKEDDLWVNLSPYEHERMISDGLGKTELGRDMLAQDYILKQLSASLMDPEKDLGRAFWNRVYARAREQFGTTDIPLDTFNKVWIMADKAKVLERDNAAYVVGGHLKVMLESDYHAQEQALTNEGHSAPLHDNQRGSVSPGTLPAELALDTKATQGADHLPTQELSKSIIQEIILPEIEKEVNQGKTFAPLRQVFYAMILASWYRLAVKDALLNQVYSNKGKTDGVLSDDPVIKEKIYQQYLEAYRKGVFNYIKDEFVAEAHGSSTSAGLLSEQAGEFVPRKYFSGGFVPDFGIQRILDRAQTISTQETADMSQRGVVVVSAQLQSSSSEAGDRASVNTQEQIQEEFHLINHLRNVLGLSIGKVIKDAEKAAVDGVDELRGVFTDENLPVIMRIIAKTEYPKRSIYQQVLVQVMPYLPNRNIFVDYLIAQMHKYYGQESGSQVINKFLYMAEIKALNKIALLTDDPDVKETINKAFMKEYKIVIAKKGNIFRKLFFRNDVADLELTRRIQSEHDFKDRSYERLKLSAESFAKKYDSWISTVAASEVVSILANTDAEFANTRQFLSFVIPKLKQPEKFVPVLMQQQRHWPKGGMLATEVNDRVLETHYDVLAQIGLQTRDAKVFRQICDFYEHDEDRLRYVANKDRIMLKRLYERGFKMGFIEPDSYEKKVDVWDQPQLRVEEVNFIERVEHEWGVTDEDSLWVLDIMAREYVDWVAEGREKIDVALFENILRNTDTKYAGVRKFLTLVIKYLPDQSVFVSFLISKQRTNIPSREFREDNGFISYIQLDILGQIALQTSHKEMFRKIYAVYDYLTSWQDLATDHVKEAMLVKLNARGVQMGFMVQEDVDGVSDAKKDNAGLVPSFGPKERELVDRLDSVLKLQKGNIQDNKAKADRYMTIFLDILSEDDIPAIKNILYDNAKWLSIFQEVLSYIIPNLTFRESLAEDLIGKVIYYTKLSDPLKHTNRFVYRAQIEALSAIAEKSSDVEMKSRIESIVKSVTRVMNKSLLMYQESKARVLGPDELSLIKFVNHSYPSENDALDRIREGARKFALKFGAIIVGDHEEIVRNVLNNNSEEYASVRQFLSYVIMYLDNRENFFAFLMERLNPVRKIQVANVDPVSLVRQTHYFVLHQMAERTESRRIFRRIYAFFGQDAAREYFRDAVEKADVLDSLRWIGEKRGFLGYEDHGDNDPGDDSGSEMDDFDTNDFGGIKYNSSDNAAAALSFVTGDAGVYLANGWGVFDRHYNVSDIVEKSDIDDFAMVSAFGDAEYAFIGRMKKMMGLPGRRIVDAKAEAAIYAERLNPDFEANIDVVKRIIAFGSPNLSIYRELIIYVMAHLSSKEQFVDALIGQMKNSNDYDGTRIISNKFVYDAIVSVLKDISEQAVDESIRLKIVKALDDEAHRIERLIQGRAENDDWLGSRELALIADIMNENDFSRQSLGALRQSAKKFAHQHERGLAQAQQKALRNIIQTTHVKYAKYREFLSYVIMSLPTRDMFVSFLIEKQRPYPLSLDRPVERNFRVLRAHFYVLGQIAQTTPEKAIFKKIYGVYVSSQERNTSDEELDRQNILKVLNRRGLYKGWLNADDLGGIDLNTKHMEISIDREGPGVEMSVDPAVVAQFQRGDFTGIVPVIVSIVPVSSALSVLGMPVSAGSPH
ncbi:MAG: hypothetical protein V2A70_08325 [Candidatus Omnitrophota bacterium]